MTILSTGTSSERCGSPLQQFVSRTAERARWLMWVRAGALAIAGCVAILALVGTLDVLLRPRATWLRWLLAVSGWVAAAFVLVEIFRRAWRSRFDLVSVARRIERTSPALGDRLSNAVALFAAPVGGSSQESQFRQSAIRRVESVLAATPPRGFLSFRSAGAALLSAAAVVAAVSLAFALLGTHAEIAAARLVPWSDARYPVRDDLRIAQLKETVAAGSNLDFRVHDLHGALPDDLRIEVRDGGTGRDLTSGLAIELTAEDKSVARIEVRNVQQSIELRAVGGDCTDPPWHGVRVVRGAEVVRSTFLIVPPEYTQRPRQEVEATKVAAPEGSRVELRVKLNQPIDPDSLRYEPLGDAAAGPPQLAVTEDGRTIEAVIEALAAAYQWRFGWQTLEGAKGESDFAWGISVIADTLPETRWVDPSSGPVTVSPQARVEAEFVTVDDYGLSDVSVAAVRSTGKPLPLVVEPSFGGNRGGSAPARWQASVAAALSDYDLGAGEEIDLVVSATDTSGATAASPPLHIIVVAAEVIREQADRIRESAADALRSAIREHRTAEQELRRAAEALSADRDAEAAKESLRHSEQAQRSSQLRIAEGPGAAADRLRESADLLRDNQAGDPEPDTAMSHALEDLAQGQVQQLLGDLQQLAQRLPESDAAVDESLQSEFERIGQRQQATRDALQRTLDRLMKEDRRRQILDSISDLAEDQSRVRAETAASDSEGDHRSAAQSQRDMARRVQQLIQDLQQLAEDNRSGTAEQRAAAAAAARQLNRANVRQNMQQAADLVQRGKIDRALAMQDEIQRALDRAARTTESSNPAISAENRRRAVEQLSEQLQNAVVEQEELLEKQQSSADERAEDASDLAEELEGLGDEARDLELPEVAENLDRASQSDLRAAEQFSRGKSPDQEVVRQELQQAEEALRAAQRSLGEALGSAEQQAHAAAAANLARIAGRLADQQRQIVEEIKSEPSREQQLEISRRERNLTTEVSRLSQDAEGMLGFDEVIQFTVADMVEAATALAREQTQLGLQHAEAAARQLEAIAEAARWAAESRREGGQQPSETEQPQTPQQTPPESSPQNLAIAGIRLLRNLQQQLLDETSAVDELANDSAADPVTLQRRRADLSARQRRLMELTRQAVESLRQQHSGEAGVVEEVEI